MFRGKNLGGAFLMTLEKKEEIFKGELSQCL